MGPQKGIFKRTMNSTSQNEYLDFSVRLLSDEEFRAFNSGCIYWIPGFKSQEVNEKVSSNHYLLNRSLRNEESVWFDVHFRIADEHIIQMFGQREKPYLVGALIPSCEFKDNVYAFLEAEVSKCSVNHIDCACAAFLRTLVKVYDAILDGQAIFDIYSQYRVVLFGESESGLYVYTLAPGERGVYGLPTRRIASELGTLIVSEQELRLSFSGIGQSVNMPAQSRALYVLFLRHPEGIEKKYLWQYQDEMTELYKQASVEDDMNKLEATIASIVKVHNPKSRDNLKHCILRCNHELKKVIDDSELCKSYLLTKYANKRLTIPLAKRDELIQFSKLN